MHMPYSSIVLLGTCVGLEFRPGGNQQNHQLCLTELNYVDLHAKQRGGRDRLKRDITYVTVAHGCHSTLSASQPASQVLRVTDEVHALEQVSVDLSCPVPHPAHVQCCV